MMKTILFAAVILGTPSFASQEAKTKPSAKHAPAAGTVNAAHAVAAETKSTKSGHVFTRENSYPGLGNNAWKDPSGMVWGEIARDAQGKPLLMTYVEALKYCAERGAILPTANDFVRLREYMGAKLAKTDGYQPQIFGGDFGSIAPGTNRYLWSSTQTPRKNPKYEGEQAFVFDSYNGALGANGVSAKSYGTRCVVDTQPRDKFYSF